MLVNYIRSKYIITIKICDIVHILLIDYYVKYVWLDESIDFAIGRSHISIYLFWWQFAWKEITRNF